MLNVLMHKDIGEIVAVVVRFFGGIKLGAGGLVRAYSGAVQAACEQLPLTRRVSLREGVLSCDYSQEQIVRHILELQKVQLQDCHYAERVVMTVAAPGAICETLSDQVMEVSRGQIQIKWKDEGC